jgi:hypothetical protein
MTPWTLNGGSRGGDGFRLQEHEFDGYVKIVEGTDTVQVPWHILAHRVANAAPSTTNLLLNGTGAGTLPITNTVGSVPAVVNAFALIGTSPRFPVNVLPRPGDNFAIVDLRAVGIRVIPDALGPGADVIQFAVTTFGERSHPNYPAEFDVFIDTNSDGNDDFVVFTAENTGAFASGQNVTTVLNLSTSASVTRFFTDADLWSSNAILTVLGSDVGLSRTSQFRLSFFAFDNYFTGVLTDAIGPLTVKLDAFRFSAPDVNVPVNGLVNVPVTHNPAGDTASPSQTGLLLMHREARKGREADLVTVVP